MTFSSFRYKWMGYCMLCAVVVGIVYSLAKAVLAMLGVG